MAEHKITPRSYLLVFAALLVLTFTTVLSLVKVRRDTAAASASS